MKIFIVLIMAIGIMGCDRIKDYKSQIELCKDVCGPSNIEEVSISWSDQPICKCKEDKCN